MSKKYLIKYTHLINEWDDEVTDEIIIDEVLKPHNFYFYENEGTIKVSSF